MDRSGFLALYLDDEITRSLTGVEEAKRHALVVARICGRENSSQSESQTTVQIRTVFRYDKWKWFGDTLPLKGAGNI